MGPSFNNWNAAGRRARAWWIIACVFLAPVHGGRAAPAPTTAEYQIKAAFLFNFAQFVEWPATAFPSPQSPIVIGIYGEDPFRTYLDDLVTGEHVGGRSLVVRRYKRGERATDCQMLFVCRSEADTFPDLLVQLHDRPVLTVSDLDTFTRDGGMVRFAVENGKTRLKISLAVAKAHGLSISSKILRPATIVTKDQE